jgi:hypothetical protein
MVKISKKLMTLTLLGIIAFLVVSCGEDTPTTEGPTTEQINHDFDMDTVYFRGEGYEVTYGDLYQSIKTNDGDDQLIELVDRDLLSEYFDDITQEAIDNKRIQLIYGTTDQETIDDLDEDQVEDLQKSYENGMIILGYGDNDVPYIELLVARDLYVKDLLTNPDIEDNDFYIDYEDVIEEYIKRRVGQVSTILLRYDTFEKASNVLRSNNLVEYNGALRLYTDTSVPLENVPSHKLSDANTRALTDQELLSFYIQFYNLAYDGQRDPLDTNASVEDLIANEDLTYEFEDLSTMSIRLGDLLFKSLSTIENPETIYYTYKPYEVTISNDKEFFLMLNLNKTYIDLSDFEGDKADLVTLIGQDIYDELEADLIEENLNDSTFMQRRLKALREDHGFEILDYYLKLDYDNVVPEDMEANILDQSNHVIAVYDDVEVQVKDLLAFALERKAPLYLLHASQLDILRSEHYNDVYCDDEGECELDYTQNNSGAMNNHLNEYNELEQSFNNSQYATFYSFDDYLYLAYVARNDVEMINSYVKRTLEPLYIYDYLSMNTTAIIEDMMAIINDYYDNYFSLDVRHILVYIDENGDGRPDDFDAYYDDLEDTTTLDQLIGDIYTDMQGFLSENEDDLAELVSAYNDAESDDELWGPYKRFGLKIMTENLSSSGSLTYMGVHQNYDQGFVDGLIALYQRYQESENIDKDFLYSDAMVRTSFGLHLIKSEPGEDFEMPSADFTVPEDTTYNYPEGLNNEDVRVSASQIAVFIDYRIFDIASTSVNLTEIYDLERPDLPARIKDVLEMMVQNIHDGFYANAYLNVAMMETLVDGELADDSAYSFFTEAEIFAMFEDLSLVYTYQVFSQFE